MQLIHTVLFLDRKKPNLIVHLDVSPEESKRRIDMRQRECESTISLEYLKNLHAAYEEFIKDISRIIPVIRVNYERFRSADEMADMIVRWVRVGTTVYKWDHLLIYNSFLCARCFTRDLESKSMHKCIKSLERRLVYLCI